MENRNKKVVALALSVFAIILVTIGVTYAFFSYSRTGKENIIKAGDLEFAFLEGETVTIEKAFPISEERGMTNKPFEFNVTNNSSVGTDLYYSISLLSFNNNPSDKYFENEHIRVNVYNKTKDTYVLGTATTGVLLSSLSGFNKGDTFGESKITFNLVSVAKTTEEYELRMWIDENTNYSPEQYDDLSIGVYNDCKYSLKVKVNASSTSDEIDLPTIVDIGNENLSEKNLSVGYPKVSGLEKYVMATTSIKTDSKIYDCGTGDYPGECAEVTALNSKGIIKTASSSKYTMEAYHWYKFNDYNNAITFKSLGTVYAMYKLNNQHSEKVLYKVNNLDTQGPVCTFTSMPYIGVGIEKTMELSCVDTDGTMSAKTLTSNNLVINNKNITVTNISSPESIANGYKYTITVKGNNAGKSQIKLPFKTVMDDSDHYNLNAFSNEINVTNLTVGKTNVTIDLANSSTYKITTNGTNMNYESGDQTIANVNENGLVTGLEPGVTTIKVTDTDSGSEKTINLVVIKTLSVNYRTTTGVSNITIKNDTCVVTSGTTCLITLPGYTTSKPRYLVDGYYEGETKVGEIGDTLTISENKTYKATSKKNFYTVTYNATTNGGTTTATNEEIIVGDPINLNYTAIKSGLFSFVGWNTNSKATSGLDDLNMGEEDITLYAIFESRAPQLLEVVKLGDYVKYVPSKSSYTPDKTITGCAELSSCTQGALQPNKTTSWRVLNITEDGIEITSNTVSSEKISIYGKTGLVNYAYILNQAALAYETENVTVGSRAFGYDGQTEILNSAGAQETLTKTSFPFSAATSNNLNESIAGGDTMYKTDVNLANAAGITMRLTSQNYYWFVPSRFYWKINGGEWGWSGMYVDYKGGVGKMVQLYTMPGKRASMKSRPFRPVVVLRKDIKALSGDGASGSPWVIEQ